ncbi:MAG: flagellar biosynthetic protein FliO [Alicyclobacillus macrosporangiidus]|uniref:flagellar biosynthetic protein FliO n=1 Tax=Alicyclobacillus macrosporangiidus TaxID=392015 RepID=UPI0026EE92A0|nr:flagellar biosynthetic protein FliO [Alicyclobacillus macrosporangiidus]MCL6597355.1 flagellar biosynthetic protein FliO [Alicyclobacillus macrosporangiidus]
MSPSVLGNPVWVAVQLLLSLAVVLALAVVAIRYLAHRSRFSHTAAIQVLAARQVAPNRSVQVIEVHGRRYLIGVGDQVSLLADVTDHFPPAQREPQRSGGGELFARVLSERMRRLREQDHAGEPGKET